MVDVKQAVFIAKQYAVDTLGIADVLLEEIKSDPTVFHVTLSFANRQPPSAKPAVWSRYRDREFKVFDIEKESGDVVGMSIRTLSLSE